MMDGGYRGAVMVCLLSAVAGVSSQACVGQSNDDYCSVAGCRQFRAKSRRLNNYICAIISK